MRKITLNAVNAFENCKEFKGANTTVEFAAYYEKAPNLKYDLTLLKLHGNVIAIKERKTGRLYITNAGWKSNTTKERLNGLDGVNINQSNFEWYLNGKGWNGKLTEIK